MTTATALAPAPIVRNDDLDELMVETVAALAHVTHLLDTGAEVTPGVLAEAVYDNTTVQRYLGRYYPSGHGTTAETIVAEFRWTLAQAADCGLRSVG